MGGVGVLSFIQSEFDVAIVGYRVPKAGDLFLGALESLEECFELEVDVVFGVDRQGKVEFGPFKQLL